MKKKKLLLIVQAILLLVIIAAIKRQSLALEFQTEITKADNNMRYYYKGNRGK